MGLRTDFHVKLVEILGSNNVYFQPPASIELQYPCVIYKRIGLESQSANDIKYKYRTRYQVTCIDKNPDATWTMDIFNLPMCAFLTRFSKSGLNHDLFSVYY